MHIDLLHAVASAAVILGTLWGLKRLDVISHRKKSLFDWRVFGAVFLAMLVLNLLWPGSGI